MATVDPQDLTPPAADPDAPAGGPGRHGDTTPPAGPAPQKRRNWWIWACAGLAIVAIGLLVWGVNRQSALDSSEQDVAELQSQADQNKDTGGAVVAAFKGAYDDLTQQLGSTNEDLEATQEDLADAQQTATQAEQDAASAKQDAENAKDQTEKAQAQADQAKADAKNAQSKGAIVKDCAKAYVSALGGLFDGDSIRAQASAVRQDLQSISGDCSGALAETP